MKFACTVLLSLLFAASVLADDASIERSKPGAEAERQAWQKLEAEQRAKAELEKPLTYGGFLVDVAKAKKKSKLLSLRQPADPKGDARNLYRDPKTARPKGFVLFSIGF